MFYYFSSNFLHFINYFINVNETDKRINDLEEILSELKKELNIIKIQLEQKHIINTVKNDFFTRMKTLFPGSSHHHHLYTISDGICKNQNCSL